MSIELDKATGILVPASYKANKLYGFVPDNEYTEDIGNPPEDVPKDSFDFTVTRASIGSRINEDLLIQNETNDAPRLQYPTCPSVLIEPARTNLITYPVSFDNAYWTKLGASVVGGQASPHLDYPTDAYKLVESAVDEAHYIMLAGSVSVPADSSVNISIFGKKGERDWLVLRDQTTSHRVFFDLANGTIGEEVGAVGTIETLADGWYRCSMQYTITGGGTIGRPRVGVSNADNVNVYLGDGVSGIYAFGMQAEVGTYSTSFIYDGTEGATVNRAVDSINRDNLKTNGLVTQDDYTIFIDFKDSKEVNAQSYLINFGNSAGASQFRIQRRNDIVTVWRLRDDVNGSWYVAFSDNEIPAKFIIRVTGGVTMVAFKNGVKSATDYTITLPFDFNSITNDTTRQQEIGEVLLFPTALTDEECIELTT